MATSLNLYPARVRFCNNDGTLTAEAYRALLEVFRRVGGALGDNGSDVFASAMSEFTGHPSALETVSQMVVASQSTDNAYPDVMQPLDGQADTLILKQGSATEPSLAFKGDLNTGLFSPGTGLLSVTNSGIENVRFDNVGNVGIKPTYRFYFDGVNTSGDTYITETSANVLNLFVGGTKTLSVLTTGIELLGSIKTGAATGITTTITSGTLVGKTITVTNGLITNFA